MQFLADENSKQKFHCHGCSKLVTMFAVALSLAGHFVPWNLCGVYMQPLPTQTARQRSAKSCVSQPPSLQCYASAGCQSSHLAN